MKKTIILILSICLILCGCNKEETKTSETTTPNLTESPTPIISDTEQTSSKIESECQICGEKLQCNVYTKEKWDNDLGMNIEKTYYLCDDCYAKILKNESECDNYNSIVMAANIVCTDEKVITEISKSGKVQIIINSKGVSLNNGGENLSDALKRTLTDIMDITTSEEYEIEIDCSNGWCNVKKIKSPSNILSVLVD